jgi:secreted PhoX family phosphatase
MTAELCAIEQAAHGGTIMEIVRGEDGGWAPVVGSPVNRRVTARTPMEITGPAAGHERLRTSADPTGRQVFGTFNNCAGGITPWGTYLMAEENFNGYFLGELAEDHPEAANHARYGVPGGWYQWGRFEDRFNLNAEPREPNRFGWVVEVDPARSRPRRRKSAPRWAASSMRAQKASSRRTAGSCSIWATINALIMCINSSPLAHSRRVIAPPI